MDKELLLTINDLCKLHGYGFVPQIAQIWCEGETAIEYYEKERVERLRRLL